MRDESLIISQHNNPIMFEDFEESQSDSDDDEEEDVPQPGQQRKKKTRHMDVNRLSIAYKFLMNVSDGLSNDQVRSVHQNPLQYIRTDKPDELLELYHKDERFRGMMELYGMFRELIAQERVTRDKTARMGQLSQKMTQLTSKMSYVEEALGVLVRHLAKADAIGPGPPTAAKPENMSSQMLFGNNSHLLSSGI